MFETCDRKSRKSIFIALTGGKKDYIALDYIVGHVWMEQETQVPSICSLIFQEKSDIRFDTVVLTLLCNKDKRQQRVSRQKQLPEPQLL